MNPLNRRKGYRNYDKRLKNIVNSYGLNKKLDHLRNIAKIILFN